MNVFKSCTHKSSPKLQQENLFFLNLRITLKNLELCLLHFILQSLQWNGWGSSKTPQLNFGIINWKYKRSKKCRNPSYCRPCLRIQCSILGWTWITSERHWTLQGNILHEIIPPGKTFITIWTIYEHATPFDKFMKHN